MSRVLLSLLLSLAFVFHATAAYDPTASGSRLVGKLAGANMNSTADQAIPIRFDGSKYVPLRIYVTNASTSLTLAAGGIYTATSKGGTAIVAAGQVYSALTSSSKTLQTTIAVTDTRTESTLYLSLTTAQGSAATADVYVFADVLP